jgi:hypothetical protein
MAKRMIWRYVFAVQIAKHLVAHAKAAHQKTPSVVSKLHTFLVDNGELDVPKSKFYESIKKLKASLKLQAFGVAVEVSSPSEGIHADHQLDVVERHIERAIKELACPVNHPRLLLLVDQLEDVWSEESESDHSPTRTNFTATRCELTGQLSSCTNWCWQGLARPSV